MKRLSLVAFIVLSGCASPEDDRVLAQARSIRNEVCDCKESACFDERTALRWSPFASDLQAWWDRASPDRRAEMEQLARDVGGLCAARAAYPSR